MIMGEAENIPPSPSPILDDLLTFVRCKMDICPKETLVDTVKRFYDYKALVSSRDLLFAAIPNEGPRRVKNREADKMVSSIYDVMQSIPTDLDVIFAATNINNMPCLDMKNIDGANLTFQQDVLKDQMRSVNTKQNAMQEQLEDIQKILLELKSAHDKNSTNGASETYVRSNSKSFSNAVKINSSANVKNKVTIPNILELPPINSRNSNTSTEDHNILVNTEDRSTHDKDEEEGFTQVSSRRRKRRSNAVTGKKVGTTLKAVPRSQQCRIFVSRLDPELEANTLKLFVSNLTGEDCTIAKLTTKFSGYASFFISCDVRHKNKFMSPDEWEEGVLLRPYYGKLPENIDNGSR